MQNFRSWVFRTIASLVLILVLVAPAIAADLSGVLTYKTAAMDKPSAIASAMVSASNLARPQKLKVVTRTNLDGEFRFKDIPAGRYIIIVEKDGRRLYQGSVEVEEPAKRLDIQL